MILIIIKFGERLLLFDFQKPQSWQKKKKTLLGVGNRMKHFFQCLIITWKRKGFGGTCLPTEIKP